MQIGVISDTHLSNPTEKLYQLMDTVFADVDLILHAGDLTSHTVLDAFGDKKVVAVTGNMDHVDVTSRLATKEIIKAKAFQIGLIHGWGAGGDIEDRIMEIFLNVDVIVYGHTHKAVNHIKNGVLLFNPGAFSGSFPLGKNPSVGLLTVGKEIKGTIIPL